MSIGAQIDGQDDTSKASGISPESSAMKTMNKAEDDVTTEKDLDVDTMKHMLATLKGQEEADKLVAQKRDKELAAIKVNKEDVTFVATEMNIPQAFAQRRLQEANGDMYSCLKSLIGLT